jgi:inner membrane protein
MDPLTHALTSYALARTVSPTPAGRTTLLVVAAGIAPDLDVLANLAGPSAGLRFGGAVTHSVLGATVLTAALAFAFSAWERKQSGDRHSFFAAFGFAALGIFPHLLLDLTNSYGLALIWPFSSARTAWGLTPLLDPILLSVLLLALLLPGLFRLITEEIGARSAKRAGRGWAIAALVFLGISCGGRFLLHERAVTLLSSSQFHGRGALHVGAFADSANPFHWLGVAETEASIEEIEVPLGTGKEFNPDRSRTYFKPEASPALDAARSAPGAARFLALARFPSASVESTDKGWRVQIRDIGFSPLRDARGYWFASVELDGQARVIREELDYAAERAR